MTREIKFRAWEQNIRLMAYPSDSLQMSNDEGASHLSQGFNIDNRRIELASQRWDVEHEGKLPCIIMQYTGLKDKNGKEIYEGDVVNVVWTDIYGGNNTTKVVEWDNGYHFPHSGAHTFKQTIEVIGNIYENPELL